MARIYVTLVLNGRRSFQAVPDELKEEVRQSLYSMGYDENGVKLETIGGEG